MAVKENTARARMELGALNRRGHVSYGKEREEWGEGEREREGGKGNT